MSDEEEERTQISSGESIDEFGALVFEDSAEEPVEWAG